jgi:hypothetical protein
VRRPMRSSTSARVLNWPAWLGLSIPALVAVALMAPRILDAHFGLFDDPSSISIAQRTWSGDWDWRVDAGYGRFRPVYWLAFSLMYGWAGNQAVWYFCGNLLLLAGMAWLLSLIVLRLTHRHLAAAAAGIAFVLGGPVIEAAYTLSKPELLQCFLPDLLGSCPGLVVPDPFQKSSGWQGAACVAVRPPCRSDERDHGCRAGRRFQLAGGRLDLW